MYSSGPSNQLRHLSPSTQCVRVRACMIAFARCRRVCVCVCVFTSVRCMNLSCACVPCAFSHERAWASTCRVRAWSSRVRILNRALPWRLVCVRGNISCACAAVACVRSRACVCSRRVCAFTSVRVHRRLVCAVCVLTRALWIFGPFPAAKLIKYILTLSPLHYESKQPVLSSQ